MKLIDQIKQGAEDSNTNIADVLRRCMVLASWLNNEDLRCWAGHELNGYPSAEGLPSYRILKCQSFGNFLGVMHMQRNNTPIPPSAVPEKYREFVTDSYLTEPIASYADILSNAEGIIAIEWPHDLVVALQGKIIQGWVLTRAWRQITRGQLAALMETVRTRILSFVLEIEQKTPNAGEPGAVLTPAISEHANDTFQAIIYGGVVTVAQGTQANARACDFTVVQGNIESLKVCLADKLGLADEDLSELTRAIAEDEASGDRVGKGAKVVEWLGKMMNKAAAGALKVPPAVAANLLTRILFDYMGWTSTL